MNKPQRIEISYKTIIFTVVFLASLVLLWQIRSILLLFFVCFMIMEAINPTIVKLEKIKIPRPLAILIIYALILTVLGFTVATIIPILIEQTTGLINSLPSTLDNISIFGITPNTIDWSSQLQLLEKLPAEIAKTVVSIFSNVVSGVVILVVTFYLLLERKNIDHYSFNVFGQKGKEKVIKLLENLEARLGHWLNAELILMTVVGILSYLGYTLIGLKYAVPLALVAGLMEAVPNIGPTVTTVLAALVGLTISPVTALFAILVGLIIQQLENNFLVPKVMKETVGLNPLITILVIAIGAKLAGIVGAILAVPVYLTIEIILKVIIAPKK
ncbi:MAG TPA: AI-2E family transporter [Candidatus Woesebacteria bacterium]|nr:AI-2E family transporter [Candidatus Woesebacteria bacterium]